MQVPTPIQVEAVVGQDASAVTSDESFVVEESVGFLVNRTAKAFARALAERLAAHETHLGQGAELEQAKDLLRRMMEALESAPVTHEEKGEGSRVQTEGVEYAAAGYAAGR